MASKSFTALPSVVSVAAERTYVALRCNKRGFEKVTWPVVAIVLTALSFALFAVAAGTEAWTTITVVNGTDYRGFISFGLFRGEHNVQFSESPIVEPITDSYYIFERFEFNLNRVYAAFAFIILAGLFCVLLIVATFLNSYQTVSTWWKGPPIMYLLSFLIVLCGSIAIGLFLDFYVWDMTARQVFLESTTSDSVPLRPGSTFTYPFEYLLVNEGYSTVATLRWSFGLQVAGTLLPVLVLFISWRLNLLLPLQEKKEKRASATAFESEFEMQLHQQQEETQQTHHVMQQQRAMPLTSSPIQNEVFY